MPLSQRQLTDVCMLYSGDHRQCRYLEEDDADSSKWYCLKKKTIEKKKIDKRINQFIQDCTKKGVDPKAQNIPLADNCAGYPILKIIDQGYDC